MQVKSFKAKRKKMLYIVLGIFIILFAYLASGCSLYYPTSYRAFIPKALDSQYKEFNDTFTFLRQCYGDITEPFFEWLEKIKKQSIADNIDFTQFEKLFNEFIESKNSNLDSIEGFFGFAPVESATNHWGKVFENSQYVSQEI